MRPGAKECDLKEPTKAILELFVEKADELAKEDFTRFLEEFGHQLSYHFTVADPQQLTMSTVAPTQTMHKSFLLTYRMFVQVRDNIGFIDPDQKISIALLDPSFPRVAQRGVYCFPSSSPSFPSLCPSKRAKMQKRERLRERLHRRHTEGKK
jgi:hypothetical protein